MHSKPPHLILLLAFLTLAGFFPLCQGAETDNFHGRTPTVADSIAPLDAFVNSKLDEAIKIANEKPGCAPEALHKAISKILGGMPFGAVENFADINNNITKVAVPRKQNIYSRDSILFTSLAVPSSSPMIRLAGHWCGTDKLGHFFSDGFDYYIRGRGSVIDAFNYGIQSENGNFGLETTGVKSYADMAANYGGLQFYRNVFQGESPYFQCREGRFVRLARRFTWKDYVNDAWDEAINCSVYSSEMRELVSKNMSQQGLKCPLSEEACKSIGTLQHARRFVNPECLKLAKQAPPRGSVDADSRAGCAPANQPGQFQEVRQKMRTLARPLQSVAP